MSQDLAATIARVIREGTHGDPPDRSCLPGSDEKWQGYQLAVEDAVAAVETHFEPHDKVLVRTAVWIPDDGVPPTAVGGIE